MAITIQSRRDTLARWTSFNPVPLAGEICVEIDSGKAKIGNGTSTYTSLPYIDQDTDTTYSIQDGELSEINFTSADHTKLDGIETGADVTDTTNVVAALTAGNNVSIAADGTISSTGGGSSTPMSDAEVRAAVQAATDSNVFTDADHTKLDSVDETATPDQTGAEIKTAYEGEADTNAFTDADHTKLDGIASGATVDQTGAEIKVAYENEADTNAFDDAAVTKLAGIDAAATAYGDTDVATHLGAFDGHILPDTDSTYDIGSATNKIRDLYVSDNSIHIGDSVLSNDAGTLKFDNVAVGSGGGSAAPSPTLAELALGTETAARSYSPADIKAAIESHSATLGGGNLVTTTHTIASTPFIPAVPAGDDTQFGPNLDTWTLSEEDFPFTNTWSTATPTATADTDSDGYVLHTIADTATGGGQDSYTFSGVKLNDFIDANTSKDVTFEVEKAGLDKAWAIIIYDGTSAGSFISRTWIEIKGATGAATVKADNGNLVSAAGVTVTDMGDTRQYTFNLTRNSDDLHLAVSPVIRADDANTGYSAQATQTIKMSQWREKDVAFAGSPEVAATNTVTATATTLIDERKLSPIVKTVDTTDGSTLNPKEACFAIVMGQSNAAGVYGTSPDGANISGVYTMKAGDLTFSAYSETDSNCYAAEGSDHSNPLTEMVREWDVRKTADPTTPDLYIINISKGGSGFRWDQDTNSRWDPFCRKDNLHFYDMPVDGSSSNDASLFHTARIAIKEALVHFAKEGIKAYHIGTVWNQWESDSQEAGATNRYGANLQLVRKMVDQELGLTDADFYTWRPIKNTQNGVGTDQLKSTFDKFVQENKNCFMIDVRDHANYTGVSPSWGVFGADNLHYDAATQVESAKFVLDNSWFSVDGNGDSTRRAREVVMDMSNFWGTLQFSDNGTIYSTSVSDTGTFASTTSQNQPL